MPGNVKFLMLQQEHTIIMTLLHSNMQVSLPIMKIKPAKTLRRVLTNIWEGESNTTNAPEYIEKYLKASDFIKALIESRKHKEITMQQVHTLLNKFLIELQSYLDFEEIFGLMFRY